MFEYFTPVYAEEHMLFISEIAELYNIKTTTNKPHVKLLKAWFDTDPVPPLYYNTKKGLCRVYPYYYYDKMVELLLKEIKDNKVIINNTKYNVIIESNHS